jgi:hypothetical protein
MKLIALVVFMGSIFLGGWYVYSHRDSRNDSYEFCTTRACGRPFPWKIENCECDGRGGLTEMPASSKVLNAGAVLVFASLLASPIYFSTRFRG